MIQISRRTRIIRNHETCIITIITIGRLKTVLINFSYDSVSVVRKESVASVG